MGDIAGIPSCAGSPTTAPAPAAWTGSTSFTTTWDIGTSGSGGAGEILDGSYQITAQPFDDRDVAGEAKRANIVLDRRRAVRAALARRRARDTRLKTDWVDLEWSAELPSATCSATVPSGPGADAVVGNADDGSGLPGAGRRTPTVLEPSTTSCVEPAPPPSGRDEVLRRGGRPRTPTTALRDGDRRSLSVSGRPARARPRARDQASQSDERAADADLDPRRCFGNVNFLPHLSRRQRR